MYIPNSETGGREAYGVHHLQREAREAYKGGIPHLGRLGWHIRRYTTPREARKGIYTRFIPQEAREAYIPGLYLRVYIPTRVPLS